MTWFWIGIGSNHQPRDKLDLAVGLFRQNFSAVEVAPYYETPCVRDGDAHYLNTVAKIATDLPIAALKAFLISAEAQAGRRRDTQRVALDLDVLLGPGLRHPDLDRYLHVAVPMAMLERRGKPPGLSCCYEEVVESLIANGAEPIRVAK
ncbi:MAG: 2-amino-4-hydroxy-6-hydroxymethyldihydropteridine diphosphokinase [Pseudomonadota bacterium]